MKVAIAGMVRDDWAAVRRIYEQGIASGNATFEQSAPEWDQWHAAHLESCRVVAKDGVEVVGWAALSRVSARAVYRGVAEVSVYVAEHARGQGVGLALLQALVQASEANGIWTLQAGIFPENHASVRLHELCGFRLVGTRERIGWMDGRWRDTVLMERRSGTVGQ